MKRFFLLIMIAAMLTCTSCGNPSIKAETENGDSSVISDDASSLNAENEPDVKALADEILNGLSEDISAINDLIFYGESVNYDGDSVEANGAAYYPVTGELKSISDIAELLNRVYSYDRANELLSIYTEGDQPVFIEVGDALYRQDAYSSGEYFLLPINHAEKISDDLIEARAERGNQDEYSAVISIVKENEKWKINSVEYKLKPLFENAYNMAIPDIPADEASSITELNQKGLPEKIFEAKFVGDRTACLIGRQVRSDNSDDIYANQLSVGISSDCENFFIDRSLETVFDDLQESGYYRIFKNRINEYLRTFDLDKDGKTHQIIALRYYTDPEEENVSTVFFALTDNELIELAGDFSEAGGSSYEIHAHTSSNLMPDGNTILDLSTGTLYTFDFDAPISSASEDVQYTAAISAE